MIRIERATVRVVRLPAPPALAAGPAAAPRAHALLRVRGLGDATGQGEAAPLPRFSKDTMDEVLAGLADFEKRALPLSLGRGDFESRLDAALAPLALSPSARFACESAVLDLAGQQLGVGVAELLAGHSVAGRRIPVHHLLPEPGRTHTDNAAVDRGLTLGVTTFKMKIGRAGRFETELARIERLRHRFGRSITLRLDANEAFTLDEARRVLDSLAPHEPDLVEQPVARDELFRLTAPPVPVAADESLQIDGALERLIDAGVCDAVIVKPAAVGGLFAARRIARRAHEAGLRVVVTHLLDGPVGVAAAAELALSLDPPPSTSGLAAHPGLDAWDVLPPQLDPAAVVSRDAPGLGLPLLEAGT